MKCKHEIGWISTQNFHIFEFEDGRLQLTGARRFKNGFTIELQCNHMLCNGTKRLRVKLSK